MKKLCMKICKKFKSIKRDSPWDRVENKNKALILANSVNAYLASYKNVYAGKDIYIVGSGPSEEYFEPIDNSAVYIGVNFAFRDERIKFDYLFGQDYIIAQSEDFAKYRDGSCVKMLAWITGNNDILIRNSDAHRINHKRYVLDYYPMDNFPYDISVQPFADLRGTVFSALQFALYTDPRRIFLVGFDCSIGDVFKKNMENFSFQKKSWEVFKKYSVTFWPSTQIVSINPVGLKGLFIDKYTDRYKEKYGNAEDK